MTDQPRLREALHRAVPEAPAEPDRGAAVRGIAARRRRTRQAWVGALAAVVALGGTGVWATHRHDTGMAVAGTGDAACHALAHRLNAGTVVDDRIVDGPTAARWLTEIRTEVEPSTYRDDRQVTVCLTVHGTIYRTYVVGGGHAEQVTAGAYSQVPDSAATVMARLDRLRTGGDATTDAPFSCSGPATERYPDVTVDLPMGATGAMICFDSPVYTPDQVLTQKLDRLVKSVNDTRIEYSTPDFVCSPAPGDYGYSLVFRYPDGTRKVTAETCRGLVMGHVTRAEGHVDGTFLRLLADQALATQGFHPAAACTASPHSRPTGVGDVRHILGFRYCAPGASGAGAPLVGDDGTLLEQWGAGFDGSETEPEGHCSDARDGLPYLSLRDVWGNAFTMPITSCGRQQYPAVLAPDGRHVIYPLGRGTPLIDGLLRHLASTNP
jgi:hypothetical protein